MGNEHGDTIIHRQLDPTGDTPSVEAATVVAELEGEDPAGLTSIWGCIDDVLDEIFSNPPSPEAQMEVSFTYEGYRVTVEQNGTARFIQVG